MLKTVYHIELRTLTEVLGLNPPSEELYEKYIKSKLYREIEKLERRKQKAKDPEEIEAIEKRIDILKREGEEEEYFTAYVENKLSEERLTIFARDKEGYLSFLNYQIKGMFKELANQFLKEGYRNKFAIYTDVEGIENERFVYIFKNGKKIKEPDYILERPIRAFTRAGHIVSLIRSEAINPPAVISFRLKVIGNPKLHKIDEEVILEMLGIGRELGALGQWRTAGFGKFEVIKFEKIEETEINSVKKRKGDATK